MGYGTASVKRFGGLQLSTDPSDVGLEQAVEATNVEIAPDRSFVRVRDGLTRLGAADAFGAGRTCCRMIAVDDTVLLAIVQSATLSIAYSVTPLGVYANEGDWTVGTTKFHDLVNFGTPTAVSTFVSTVGQVMQRFTGGSIGPSVGSKPKYLGVTPTTNRLIQAWFDAAADSPTGANGSRSTVFFSDLGDPITYSANNYVHLRPGDGEEIRGVAVWRGQVFVFKETTVFIFSGEGTSSTGTPIFDYRAVTLGGRIPKASLAVHGAVVGAGEGGVYYLATDGVYRTTGGPPVYMSEQLGELFRKESLVPFALGAISHRVSLHTTSEVYVFDDRHGQWVRWSSLVEQPTAPFVDWPSQATIGDPNTLMWAVGDTLYYTDRTAGTDNAQALASSYQTGLSDLGTPAVKRVRQTQLRGIGVASCSLVTGDGIQAVEELAMGNDPTPAEQMYRGACRGTLFGYRLSSAAAVWNVGSVTFHIAPARNVGAMISVAGPPPP